MKQFLLILIFLFAAIRVEAQTWYVNTATGHDVNNDCNEAQNSGTPKKTINAALDCFAPYTAGQGANKIVEVAPGLYNEHLRRFFDWPKGTSWNAPFTLRAAPGSVEGSVIVRYPTDNIGTYFHDNDTGTFFYTVVEGITFDGVNLIPFGYNTFIAARFIRLLNNYYINTNTCNGIGTSNNSGHNMEIIGSTFHGGAYICEGGGGGDQGYPIYNGSNNSIIDGNHFYDFPKFAIHNFASTCPSNVITRNNIVHDTNQVTNNAAILACGDNHKVYNNVVWNVSAGIETFRDHTGTVIYNNTIYNARKFAIGYGSTQGETVRNNAMYNSGAAPTDGYLYDGSFVGVLTASHNLCGPGGGCDDYIAGGIVGTGTSKNENPRWADPANGDFRPCRGVADPHPSCPGISPLINSGTNVASAIGCTIGTTCVDASGTLIVLPFSIGAFDEIGADPPVDDPPPLVALRLSCDNSVQDASGQNNHGTLTNGATYTSSADGKFNQACLFDGINDNVTVAAHSTLDFTHGFHLGAWVYATSKSTDALIIGKNPSNYFLFASLDSICGADALVGGFDTPQGPVFACYATGLPLNTWTRVDVSYNRTSVILYVNGKPVTSTAASAFIVPSTGTLQIGSSTFNEHFTGRIDEPYAKNAALSEAEIAALMNSPVNPVNVVSQVTLGSGTLKLNAGAAAIKVR